MTACTLTKPSFIPLACTAALALVPLAVGVVFYLADPALVVPLANSLVGRVAGAALLAWEVYGLGQIIAANNFKEWVKLSATFVLPLVFMLTFGGYIYMQAIGGLNIMDLPAKYEWLNPLPFHIGFFILLGLWIGAAAGVAMTYPGIWHRLFKSH